MSKVVVLLRRGPALLTGIVAVMLLGDPVPQAHAAPCFVFTTGLPPQCAYRNVPPGAHVMIVDGLPAGTTVEIDALFHNFANVGEGSGGTFGPGGTMQSFTAMLGLHLVGTGGLAGYERMMTMMNVSASTDTAPRNPADPIQPFDQVMTGLQGQIVGDPDFDLLRITAGNAFGLPSPGHTTLTQTGGGDWAVDSFFDITYRIDFVGNPGSQFAGRSGSTTGTIRLQAEAFDAVPEPGSLALIGFGLTALGYMRRRRRAA